MQGTRGNNYIAMLALTSLILASVAACKVRPTSDLSGNPVSEQYQWNQARLRYAFNPACDPADMNELKETIVKGMRTWEAALGVTEKIFVPADGVPADFFIFCVNAKKDYEVRGSSTVARAMGNMYMTLSVTAEPYVILHELGHMLGLYHEQQHPRRDEFLTLNWGNIKENCKSNYTFIGGPSERRTTPFDINSIMMYGSYACSINGSPTMTLKDGSTFDMPEVISSGDIATLKSLVLAPPKDIVSETLNAFSKDLESCSLQSLGSETILNLVDKDDGVYATTRLGLRTNDGSLIPPLGDQTIQIRVKTPLSHLEANTRSFVATNAKVLAWDVVPKLFPDYVRLCRAKSFLERTERDFIKKFQAKYPSYSIRRELVPSYLRLQETQPPDVILRLLVTGPHKDAPAAEKAIAVVALCDSKGAGYAITAYDTTLEDFKVGAPDASIANGLCR